MIENKKSAATTDHLAQPVPVISNVTSANAELGMTDIAPLRLAAAPLPQRTEVAFIVNTVTDWQTLAQGIKPGVQVVVLDGHGDGLTQMTDWLAQQLAGSIDAVHVFSHGAVGSVVLGSITLDSASLDARQDELAQLGQALTPNGDILLYGCNVAAGETGAQFVGRLAQLTGADVAASTNLTGAARRGGDWVLEYATGKLDATVLSDVGYQGTLAAVIVTTDQDTGVDATIDTDYSTDLADGGGLSLREALYYAGTNGAVGFAVGLSGKTITLGSNASVDAGVTFDADTVGTLTITGNTINLAGALNVTNGSNDELTIESVLSGSSTLTKSGAGALTLSPDSPNPLTSINLLAGTLNANNGRGTSSATAVTIASGATLKFSNDTWVGNISGAGSLDLTGIWLTITQSADTNFSGSIIGSSKLFKAGASSLTLSGTNNTQSWATQINAGTLNIAGSSNLATGAITLGSGATLQLTGATTLTNALTVSGNSTIQTDADVTLSGTISGTGKLTKTNGGVLVLTGTNTYSGGTSVAGTNGISVTDGANLGSGAVELQTNGVLTITGSGVTISNTFTLSGGNVSNENAVTLSGVVSGSGDMEKLGDGTLTLMETNSYTGTITVSAGTLNGTTSSLAGDITNNAQVEFTQDTDGTYAKVISGNGSVTKYGTGTVTLTGSNTYAGVTSIQAGGLILNNSGGSALSDTAEVAVYGTLTLSTNEAIGALAGGGAVALGSNTLTVYLGGNNSFYGVISGSGGFTKTGTGRQELRGNNLYTGATTVSAGTLLVNGAHSGSGALSIASGATLGGSGSIAGAVTVNAGSTLSAGTISTAEDLATGNLAIAGSLSAQLGGTTAGSGYDQLKVTGTVNLTGATLAASLINSFTPTAGNSFILIDNNGPDAVTGTFTGLAEGAALTLGGYSFKISYAGGTGNDVVLTVQDTTAPTLAITSNMTAIKAGETATISFTFSETPTGFAANDVTTTGGTLSTPTVDGGNDKLYTATFTPTADLASGTASITVAANSYTDTAGNNGGAGTTPSISIDTLTPVFTSATINGSTLVMTYTETGTLDAVNIPATTAFTVMNGATQITVNSVAVNAANKTVMLTLASAMANGAVVTVAYTDPTGGDDTPAIQDAAGNDAATLAATAVTNNTPAPTPTPTPAPTPTTTTETVDGVVVTDTTKTITTTVTHPVTGEQQIITTEVVTTTVPIVLNTRPDENNATPQADIPLARNSSGETILQASLPVGVGLTSEAVTGGDNPTLRELLMAASEPRTDPSAFADILGRGIDSYVPGVRDEAQVSVRTITLLTTPDRTEGFNAPIVINGATGTGEQDGNHPDRQEALVIDVRNLPSNTVLQLNNVEFAIIIGAARVTGGNGQNFAVGDDAAQYIVLGAEDDILHGGGGDDTVGSEGGNDLIFGDDGNDTVFGGAGSDLLHGGRDVDEARYAGSIDRYQITEDNGKTLVRSLDRPDDIDTLINVETIRFDDQVYSVQSRDFHIQIASLYTAVLGRQAEISGFQFWSEANVAGVSIGNIAFEFLHSPEHQANTEVDFSRLTSSEQVNMFYQSFLGREADQQGFDFWMAHIAGGESLENVVWGFVTSVEMQGNYLQQNQWNFSL